MKRLLLVICSLTGCIAIATAALSQESYPCTAQEYAQHGRCLTEAEKSSSEGPNAAVGIDTTKPSSLDPGNQRDVQPDIQPDGTIKNTITTTVSRCVVHGFEEELSGSRSARNQLPCFTGFTQHLPQGGLQVLGIGTSRAFDEIGTKLKCYVSEFALRDLRLDGIGATGKLPMKCVGQSQGAALYYTPWIIVSAKHRMLIASNPMLRVCGPQHLIRNGEAYKALVARFGQPSKVDEFGESDSSRGIPNAIAKVWFRMGDTVFTVSTEPAGEGVVERSLGCQNYLSFQVVDDLSERKFFALVAFREAGGSMQERPRF